MYENKTEELPVKAVLACVDVGEFDAETSIAELAELAKTANAEVVGEVIQKKSSYDPATCMGAGRLEELKDQLEILEAELVIFDHELTGIQVRNIENILDVRVIDRTTLILDIFAQRARTKEGKLQVELAQQKYRLPRLTGMGTSLSRLGGGIAVASNILKIRSKNLKSIVISRVLAEKKMAFSAPPLSDIRMLANQRS